MDDRVRERIVAHELEPGEDHPGDPEEDDVPRGREDVARVPARELRRPLGPAERGERVEGRREPGVEDVLVLPQLGRAALGAGSRLGLGDRDMAVGAVPDRDAMPPPDLARDAPVADVLHPVEVDARKALGREADAAVLDRRDRRSGELLHRHPPLRDDERLDAAVAAHAVADRVAVVLPLLEQAALGCPVEHAQARVLLRQSREFAGGVVHQPIRADHRDLGQVVVAADLEVRRVVAGGDLERACAELALDTLVRDHRHAALDERDDDLRADEMAVALVLGMDGDRDVGKDRRRPHRRDRDVAGAVGERVADVGERVVGVLVLDLEI